MARGVRAHRVAGDLNARSRTGVRWGARSDSADCGGARCSAGIEFEASQVRYGARYGSSMGRLRLGLASRPRPLEPVARRMGSTPGRSASWSGLRPASYRSSRAARCAPARREPNLSWCQRRNPSSQRRYLIALKAISTRSSQAAALRRMMLARNRKFEDSPLEGTGFEISVPRYRRWSCGSPRYAIRAEQLSAGEITPPWAPIVCLPALNHALIVMSWHVEMHEVYSSVCSFRGEGED